MRRGERERMLPGKLLDYFVRYGAICGVSLSPGVPDMFDQRARREDRDDWMLAVASE